MSGWGGFLQEYHARNPAVTEDLLLPMRGPGATGRLHPYQWLVEDLGEGPVWDVACGSAPVADVVGLRRYCGVDLSGSELAAARHRRPGVRVRLGDALTADPAEPPAAVTVAMALMLLPLKAFLARAASLLGPGGRLHAIVPTRENGAGTGYGRLLELLGQQGRGYREQLDPDRVGAGLRANGFEYVSDEVGLFRLPVGPAAVDLVLRSFYLRHDNGSGAGAAGAARAWLGEQAADPGFELDYPLRRIRAVRT